MTSSRNSGAGPTPLGWAAIGALMLVAAIAVLVATRNGPGATPDSAVYVSVAENLANGEGLRTFDGVELTHFPPGLPATLAAGSLFSLSPTSTARVLNAVSLALVVLLSFLLMRRHLGTPWLRYAGAAVVAFSPVLMLLSALVLTEIPFIAITLAFLVVFERTFHDETGIPLVIVAALVGALAFFFRYAGLAIIAFGVAALAWQFFEQRTRHGVNRVAVFAAVAVPLPALWVVHNLTSNATPFGQRTPSSLALTDGFGRTLDTMGSWFLPHGSLVGLGIVALIAGAVLLERRTMIGAQRGQRTTIVILLVFVLFYLAFVAIAASITRVDPPNDRLLSPAYVPLLVMVLFVVERSLDWLADRQRAVGWVLVAAFIVVALNVVAPWGAAIRLGADGIGFADPAWQQSDLIRVVAESSEQGPLYSNSADGIYYVLRSQPIRFGPTDIEGDFVEFRAVVRCTGPVLMAHFEAGHLRPFVLGPDQLGEGLSVELVEPAADGALYRITYTGPTMEQDAPCVP